MKDSVFGELIFKYGWRKKEILSLFNLEKEVILVVSGSEEDKILETQRQAFLDLKKEQLKKDIEKAIYEYYLSICEEYREMWEDEADEHAPLIKNISEMGKLINPIEIVVQRVNGIREVGIVFECSWDIDSGVGVRIENEKIIEVGEQYVAL